MELQAGQLLGLFAIVAIVAVATTRFSIWLSHRLDILDRPDPRKAHREPVAYLGGLGMLLAFLLGILALGLTAPAFTMTMKAPLVQVGLGALAIFLVGFYDDVRPVRAVVKLLLQIAVASWMWWGGLRVEALSFIADGSQNLGVLLSYGVTVGWYVVLMNSFNLVDGLDGLAGGIALIGAASLVGICLVIEPTNAILLGAYIAILTASAATGFLVYNWHPARTFMGDGGSLLLGFLLATSSLHASAKTTTVVALAVPLIALGLPIFEIFFSFTRRALKRQHPFRPDRRHLHHRLLDLGLDQRRVVIFLLFVTAFLGINSIILAQAESRILFFNIAFLMLGMVLLIENLKFLEKRRQSRSEAPIAQVPQSSTPAEAPPPAAAGKP